MGAKRSSHFHERMVFLTFSIGTSLLNSKERLLSALEFPSTRLPPMKSGFAKGFPIFEIQHDVVYKRIKRQL